MAFLSAEEQVLSSDPHSYLGVYQHLIWDEWQQFIGLDIPYERTCPNLPEHPSVAEARRAGVEKQ